MKKSIANYKFSGVMFDIFNYSLMIVFCITSIYPFWNLLLLSLADSKSAMSLGIRIWNKIWTFDAYKFIFRDDDVLTAYTNTIFVTVTTTILSLIMTLLGAFPLSKKDLPARNILTIIFLIPMFISGGIIPYYLIIKALGLYDNILVLIIPGIFGTSNLIIMRNFLQSMDKALEESAFIDGANYFNVLVKIIIPLITPVLATIALWTAVANWNAWFAAMIFTRGNRIMVLQILVRIMIRNANMRATELVEFNSRNNLRVMTNSMRAATIMVTIGPIIFAYPFLQKYFIKGIMIGSLKG